MTSGADRLRPEWTTLPAALRESILDAIGGAFVADAPTHGGFGVGYAGIVTTTRRTVFVKACGADGHSDSLSLLRREIGVVKRIPSPVGPEVQAAIDHETGAALILTAIDGRHPGGPWRAADLHLVADSIGALAASPAPSALPRAESDLAPDFTRWVDIAADPQLSETLPETVKNRLPELLRIEQRFAETIRGDAIMHNDLREDNILIADGRAHLLDWPYAVRAAPWADVPLLLPSIEASGGPACEDAWRLFQEHGAPDPASLLPIAAAGASYLWHAQAQPEVAQIPGLRSFQRARAVPALRWISTML
ncbi:phosphotransferase [Microbacterium sp. PMB16]|uniref:phosphotransferase n=1 Tax=Microbacterium sp. PMB16 TaxID=3120157 RepID=UPI003F4BAF09